MNKIERIVVYSLFTALLIILTFFDYALTSSLYNPSSFFGRSFFLLGEAPFQLLSVFAASLLYFFAPKWGGKKKVWFNVLFWFLIIGLSIYGGGQFTLYCNRLLGSPWHGVAKYSLFLLFGIPYFLIGFSFAYLCKKKFNGCNFLFAYGATIVVAYLGIVVLMTALKGIAFRPRYRLLVSVYEGDDIFAHWRPWYAFQTYFAKGNYLLDLSAKGVAFKVDDFASFPSGHTMNAVGIVGLGFLPYALGKKEKWGLPIRLVCYLFGALVGFSRVFLGDHNLTDSAFGFLLGVGAIDCAFSFLYPWLCVKTKE